MGSSNTDGPSYLDAFGESSLLASRSANIAAATGSNLDGRLDDMIDLRASGGYKSLPEL